VRDWIYHIVFGLMSAAILYFGFVYKQTAGSEITSRKHQLEKAKPKVVLIGDSTLRAGVDEQALQQLLGQETFKASNNGSASAWWYLYVKNVLCQADCQPEIAVIFFRDHYLTDPAFRTDGEYAKPIRVLCCENEPHIQAVLSSGLWDSPFNTIPQEAKSMWEQRVLKTAAHLVRVNKDRAKEHLRMMFDESKMADAGITAKQLASEQAKDESDFDFRANLVYSFLPAMIQELKAKKIQPVFVRMKRRRDLELGGQPELLKVYIADLTKYLEENDAILIDFTDASDIRLEHFGPGDHLNEQGKQVFTGLLAERLRGIDVNSPQSHRNSPQRHRGTERK
jgi:hypothetical protein